MEETCQLGRYLWITWEIYANVSTNNTGSWGFITAKEYRNTYRVYLVQRGETSEIMYHIRRLKANRDNTVLTCPCLKRRTCIIFVSRSLLKNPTKWISSTWKSCPKHDQTQIIRVICKMKSRQVFLYNSMDSTTTKERSTDHGPILQLHRKAYLYQTLCFHHGTSDHFSTIKEYIVYLEDAFTESFKSVFSIHTRLII